MIAVKARLSLQALPVACTSSINKTPVHKVNKQRSRPVAEYVVHTSTPRETSRTKSRVIILRYHHELNFTPSFIRYAWFSLTR